MRTVMQQPTPAQAYAQMYDTCTGLGLRAALGREQILQQIQQVMSPELYLQIGSQMLRSLVRVLPKSTVPEMASVMGQPVPLADGSIVAAAAVFASKAQAVVDDMIAAGVDAVVGAAPGPVIQMLLQLFQQLLPMLLACIPAIP